MHTEWVVPQPLYDFQLIGIVGAFLGEEEAVVVLVFKNAEVVAWQRYTFPKRVLL
ncbi:MAG: hypothetical protein R2795_15920 [Saprospiraceae bacterium]